MNQTSILGIDIAKQKFDVYFLSNSSHFVYSNNITGFKALLRRLKKYSREHTKIIMEASGGYERDLFDFFAELGFSVSIVNPKRVRDFARGLGLLAKTDKIDAKAIAKYGEFAQPRSNPVRSPVEKELKALSSRRQALVKMKAAEQNRYKRCKDQATKESINRLLNFLKAELKSLEKKISTLLKSNKELKAKADRLQSVPGVGPKTAGLLLIELPEIGKVSSKEIAALVGLAPYNSDSGKFAGRRHIRGGRGNVRQCLFMAGFVASRKNKVLKEFYSRLRERRKGHKVALIAVCRKLLVILNALIRKEEIWSDQKK